jgi:glycosyltransferase involved in cell wall biosynthesis
MENCNERLLIIFKGDFSENVAGVAVRYISVAKELAALGYSVAIAGDKVPVSDVINYVPVKERVKFAVEIFKADNIILHGGGPLILFLCAVMSLLGRHVVLDAFAPHWLELHESPGAGLKKRFKIAFNVFRLIWAAFFFDYVTVGTERQKDLVRGFLVPFGGISRMSDVHIITGGCEYDVDKVWGEGLPVEFIYKNKGTIVDFAWLGGVWPWFDVNFVLAAFYGAFKGDESIARLHFFGVDAAKLAAMRKFIVDECGSMSNVFFHDWVPFDKRIDYWQGIDCAVVWAEDGLENDYASRTRNFDCITLGVPVIQNKDHFWSVLIESNRAGLVADEGSLSDAFLSMANIEDRHRYRENIMRLGVRFSWANIAANYKEVLELNRSGVSRLSRIIGVLLSPFILMMLVFNCMSGDRRD